MVSDGICTLDAFPLDSSVRLSHSKSRESANPVASLFASAVLRGSVISFSKILRNMETAAFHLAYLLKVRRVFVY